MSFDSLTASEARRILKALGTGSAPAEFARLLLVGQKGWFDAAVKKMTETSEDQDFEVRFVRARYGGGKTHFLFCLEQEAQARKWITSFVLLKRDLVELDRFSSFVREVARNIKLPNGEIGLGVTLKSACTQHLARFGITPGKTVPLSTKEHARRDFMSYCTGGFIAPPFLPALSVYYAANLENDWDQVESIRGWLAGGDVAIVLDGKYSPSRHPVRIKPLGPVLAEEQLRVIAILCQLSGSAGLLIGVDELEIIGRLPAQRKANSFQTLRALVDQNDPQRQPPATCLFLAATPEMFEDPDKFPSYKALQDRIETLPNFGTGNQINYRANVIDLDRTPLEKSDLHALGLALVNLHELAFGKAPANVGESLDKVISQVISGRYMMARPRLLCRCVTDLLNGQLTGELPVEVAARARQLQESREREISGR
jgi:P-loop Domain of unknown function (DUF2791)